MTVRHLVKVYGEDISVITFDPSNEDMKLYQRGLRKVLALLFYEEMKDYYDLSEDDEQFIFGDDFDPTNYDYFDDGSNFFNADDLYFSINDGAVRFSII